MKTMGSLIKLIILLAVCNFLAISVAFFPSRRALRRILLPRLYWPGIHVDLQCPICTADHTGKEIASTRRDESDTDAQLPSLLPENYFKEREDISGISIASYYWSDPRNFIQEELEARFSKVKRFPDMKYSEGQWDFFNQWHGGIFCVYESESKAPLLVFTTISKNEYIAYRRPGSRAKYENLKKLLPPEFFLETIREMKEVLDKTDEDTANGDLPRNANWFGQLEKCELLRQFTRSNAMKVILFALPSEDSPWELLVSPDVMLHSWEKDIHKAYPELSVSFEVIVPLFPGV